MVPIIGRAHVGYLPAHRVVGISKLARVVDAFAKAITALDDSMPNGTYIDMCSKLPLVDPEKITVPTIVMRGQYDGIAGLGDEDVGARLVIAGHQKEDGQQHGRQPPDRGGGVRSGMRRGRRRHARSYRTTAILSRWSISPSKEVTV